MKRKIGAIMFASFAAIAAASIPNSPSGPANEAAAISRLEVIGSTGSREGVCFLVHAEPKDHSVVYSFLTASSLLDPAAVGERRTLALRMRLVLDPETVLEATGSDLRFPAGITQGLNLVVIRIESTVRGLVPLPIALEPPEVGDTFVVQGRRPNGTFLMVERVRFRSTRLIIGDRTRDDAAALIGAPAMNSDGVFGVISECNTSRVPIVTLLEAAQPFLVRAIPDWPPPRST